MAKTVNAIDDVTGVIVVKVEDLLRFLEYEEALTKDLDTASRIRNLLTSLKVWDDGGKKSR
jgi:hypothetical protein